MHMGSTPKEQTFPNFFSATDRNELAVSKDSDKNNNNDTENLDKVYNNSSSDEIGRYVKFEGDFSERMLQKWLNLIRRWKNQGTEGKT